VAGRPITERDVTPRLDALVKAGKKLDGVLVRETVEDVVDDALLLAEAKAAHFEAPPEAVSDEAIAAAWAQHEHLAEAQAAVTDADVSAWFAERRAMARMVFADEAQATAMKAELDLAFARPEVDRRKAFLDLKAKRGHRQELVPDGVLVDLRGKSELGEMLLPEDGAKVLFALTAAGQVSKPSHVGDMWLLIQQVGVRPGTPLDKVPAEQRNAARDQLVAHHAMIQLEEHVARLRRDQHLEIDLAAVNKLAHRLGIDRLSKFRKLPFNARKLQLQRGQMMPPRAPGPRPAGRDIERLMRERAKETLKPEGTGTSGGTP